MEFSTNIFQSVCLIGNKLISFTKIDVKHQNSNNQTVDSC